MSDALVAAIAAGDADAFGRWIGGAERPLRDSLRRFAASVDTEAVLQEALLRLWQVAPRFESDGKPNGFLRLGVRIAHNLAVSELRKTHREVDRSDDELRRALTTAEQHRDAPPDPILRAAIEACRDMLPPQPRAAIDARLSSHGGQPDARLAEGVHMTKNTFLQNVTRARKLLAECLAGRGVDLTQEMA